MNKLNVAVIFGGCSTEHDVSIASASTIINNMKSEKYNIIPIYITREGKWLMYDGPSKENVKNIQWDKFGVSAVISPDRMHKGLLRIVGDKVKIVKIDVVFPALHGTNAEDGTIQGLFEMAGLKYVGCGVLASSVCMDKSITKTIAKQLGVKQAEYLVVESYELEELESICKNVRYKLGYPCFVKPANGGSSVGISKVKNKKDLEKAIPLAFLFDNKIVIEKAIIGRELECAVLGDGGNETQISCVGEVIAADEFYDYDSKYNNSDSKTVLPADISEKISNEIQEISLKIFRAVNGSGLSRVDFFLENETENIIFNEINTMPGFTNISMYPMLFEEKGLQISDTIDALINIALER